MAEESTQFERDRPSHQVYLESNHTVSQVSDQTKYNSGKMCSKTSEFPHPIPQIVVECPSVEVKGQPSLGGQGQSQISNSDPISSYCEKLDMIKVVQPQVSYTVQEIKGHTSLEGQVNLKYSIFVQTLMVVRS